MTAAAVLANNFEYNFIGDEPERMGERWWALAVAQVRDEISDEPIRVPLNIKVHRTGIVSKPGADGTFCLIGRPWLRFPPLLAAFAQIDVTIEAVSYLPLNHTFTVNFDQRTIAAPAPIIGDSIFRLNSVADLVAGDTLLLGPAGATHEYVRVAAVNTVTNEITIAGRLSHGHGFGISVFPEKFAPAAPAALLLHRLPLVIGGRVVRRNTALNTTVPIFAASIAVTDFWRTQQAVRTHQPGAMTNINPALRSFGLSIAPGIVIDRATGGTFAGSMLLPPTPSQVKHLMEYSAEASQSVTLSDRAGIAIGGVVQLDSDPERAEYQTIATVSALGGVSDPAKVGLALPLVREHRAGTTVQRINPLVPPPATRTFRDDAQPGDQSIFVDGIAGLAAQGTLRITDGLAPDEFHGFARYETQSDTDGYFRLPALHRMAQVHITATAGPDVLDIDVQPDYGEREHRLDIVFAV